MSLRSTLAMKVKNGPLGLPLKRLIERVRDIPRARKVGALVRVEGWVHAHCPICSGIATVPHHRYNGFRIVRCPRDGMLFVSPRPSALGDYYDGRYYTDPDEGYRDYAAHAAQYDGEWQGRLDEIVAATGRTGRLLDVGCATGEFLKRARDRGFAVSGIELSAFAARQCRSELGLDVLEGSLPDERFGSESFDVVTFFDAVEHVADPAAVLRDILRILRPGGLLLLSTGAVPHEDPRLESTWYYPPWHLYYFSRETMTQLLETVGFRSIAYREEAGLMIVSAHSPA